MEAHDLEIIQQALKENRLFQYRPYGHPDTLKIEGWSGKPWQLDFHNAGNDYTERMEMSANQVGKTLSAGAETAFHLTGMYQDWWRGKRFDHPIIAWVGSITSESSREITQAELLGGMGKDYGTGMIPKRFLVGKPKMRQTGVSDVVDYVKVAHVSGGESSCVFKSYDQTWRKWQGKRVHVIWLDEEPSKGEFPTAEDYRIYTEGQTRILANEGIIYVTFTPLHGITTIVEHFQNPDIKSTYVVNATWDDAPHLSVKRKEELKASYPDYEVDARTTGVPMVGEGRVFPVAAEDIKCDPFEIPYYFAEICGIDFGIDHPFAAVWLAHDRDKDIIYVTDCYRKKGETTVYHAGAINSRSICPVAWPHDGMNRDKANGIELHKGYRDHGVRMLSVSARYDNKVGGGQPVEPVAMDILERMKTGRFKVFSHLHEWFEEFRMLHRKRSAVGESKIQPVKDDIMKATFYAKMMIRFAAPKLQQRINLPPPESHFSTALR